MQPKREKGKLVPIVVQLGKITIARAGARGVSSAANRGRGQRTLHQVPLLTSISAIKLLNS